MKNIDLHLRIYTQTTFQNVILYHYFRDM